MDGCPLTDAACMSGDACIVVLLDNTTPQFSVFGDIDLARSIRLSLSPYLDPWLAHLESASGLPMLWPGLW
jgi:hypothetical protein